MSKVIVVVKPPAQKPRFRVVVKPNVSNEKEAIEAELRRRLTERHLKELRASAISDEVILARGYRSISDPSDLRDIGFPDYQRRVPGYLLPP